jgi:hypothetical protein
LTGECGVDARRLHSDDGAKPDGGSSEVRTAACVFFDAEGDWQSSDAAVEPRQNGQLLRCQLIE